MNNNIQKGSQLRKIIGRVAWLVVAAGIGAFAHWVFQSPPQKPNVAIVYDTIEKTPYTYDPKGDLNIDYETDKDIFIICFRIINDGQAKDTNFIIDIRSLKNEFEIVKSEIFFDPLALKENVKKSSQSSDKNCFYRVIDPFPANSQIYISLTFSSTISEKDLKFSFLSDNRNWKPQKDKIDIRKPFLRRRGGYRTHNIAFANEDNKLKKEADLNKLKSFWTGGYYPLVLAHNLFKFLGNKEILNHSEIKEIEKMIESFELVSSGVSFEGMSGPISSLFRGFSFLRFHEIILNALIKKKILSIEEANRILEISREAGGTKFSGYNVLVLDVEILNHLLKKGYLDRHKGQQIIDDAKVKKKPAEK